MKFLGFDEVASAGSVVRNVDLGMYEPEDRDSALPLYIDVIAPEGSLYADRRAVEAECLSYSKHFHGSEVRWHTPISYIKQLETLLTHSQPVRGLADNIPMFLLASEQDEALALSIIERYELADDGIPVLMVKPEDSGTPGRPYPTNTKRLIIKPDNNSTYSSAVTTLAAALFTRNFVCIDYADIRSVLTFCAEVEYVRFKAPTYTELLYKLWLYVEKTNLADLRTVLCFVTGEVSVGLEYFSDVSDTLKAGINDECLAVVGITAFAESTEDIAIDLYLGFPH